MNLDKFKIKDTVTLELRGPDGELKHTDEVSHTIRLVDLFNTEPEPEDKSDNNINLEESK